MEPHGQARGTIITPRWGEHPVPEDQFTHGQGRGPLGTGIEIKSVEIMPRVFEKQLYSYLKGTDYKVGILVPFQLNITNPIIDLLERDK